MDRADLQLSVVHKADETVVAVSGDLDVSTAESLSTAVVEQLNAGRAHIVLDLSGLTFCDSMGLGTLVALSRTAREQQRYLVLRDPSPFLRRVLDVTGVRDDLNVT